MSDITLGLDLGPSSLGWALIDESAHRILNAGVRVFPEGADRSPQGGEQSKMQTRRQARGARRQIRRRADRRRSLKGFLGYRGLLPTNPDELPAVLALNPYGLRKRGLDEELEFYEFGRLLMHLNQRRGFRSNRKADRAKPSETKGMLAEIGELATKIHESGCRTLGEYLAGLDSGFQHASESGNDRVRARHTRRDMYEHEFDTIWEAQSRFHTELLDQSLRERVRELIFFQRDLYWPKSVIGRCELEPKEKRCSKAHRAAQAFRILQEVNNLRYLELSSGTERSLDEEQRRTLLEYLVEGRQRTFDQVRKKLGLPTEARFNLERGERDKLLGHVTDAAISARSVLGKKRWATIPEETRDTIVEVLIDENREDEALRRLVSDCGLTREESERALAVNLPEGRMSVSLVAIRKLNPHLERGLFLMSDDIDDSALHAAGYLRPDERQVNVRPFLPSCPDLPNPIVRQAMVEVRKVVNAVIREYGKPVRIHVELAREAKKSFEQRREIIFDNAKRRRLRDAASAEIARYDPAIKPTRQTVNRYLLWQEQDECCVYCGQKIGLAQLFNGEADIDHILPRWRSLDDSLANKVVCHKKCNAEKSDRTPREWLEDDDPERYLSVLRVADCLPYNKQRRFTLRDIVLDEFVQRQLRDTAYISRCVTQYLQCLGAKIVCTRGGMTAELRHWWGLNTILDPGGSGQKNRGDHRHHTIDAITIALTNPHRLHQLANARGRDMPPPWNGFREDMASAIDQITVSHRVRRRISGALHEATFYGATHKPAAHADGGSHSPTRKWARDWIEGIDQFVRRKPVADLATTKSLAKVRDATVREILRTHLAKLGVDCDKPGKIPRDAFKGKNTPRMPSGVPIKKVRMVEKGGTFRVVSDRRHYQHVKPGNNHHIVYRINGDGQKAKWSADVTPMWDAALRARNQGPVIDRSDTNQGRFVMSLSINELFEIDADDGGRVLCVVRKINQRTTYIHYKLHTDARKTDEVDRDSLNPVRHSECVLPWMVRMRGRGHVSQELCGGRPGTWPRKSAHAYRPTPCGRGGAASLEAAVFRCGRAIPLRPPGRSCRNRAFRACAGLLFAPSTARSAGTR